MIGMMYMVLTALLALNVSSAVLEKFAIIDETLVALVETSIVSNEEIVKGIEGSTVSNAKVNEAKKTAKEVRELTKGVLAYMDDIKKEMKTGDDKKPLKDLVQDTHHADELMMSGEGESGKVSMAQKYEEQLNKYVAKLNELVKPTKPFAKITKRAGEYKSFSGPEVKKELLEQPYTKFAFHGTPTMGAIAYVTQQQTEVLAYEREALNELLKVTEGDVFKADLLVAMVRAESNSVVAGTNYEGDLFLAGAASGGEDPIMFKGSEKVEVKDVEIRPGERIKMGKIKFRAAGSDFDENGVEKKSFPVKIVLPNREKPIEQVIKYTVVKPNVKFESATGAIELYRECGNIKNVSIPGFTDLSAINLTCSPEEGKIIPQGSGAYAFLPLKGRMTVKVKLGNDEIFTQRFDAVPVPEPQFVLRVQNQDVDYKKGVAPSARVDVTIRLPKAFTDQNKKDSKYTVKSMEIFTPRSGIKSVQGDQIKLSDYGARGGDNFSIYSVEVVRETFDGRKVPVNFQFTPVAIPVK
jgi:gliding motility-associated protein GldM